MSYIVLRGRWSNIVILNVYVPCEEESGDSIDSIYGELEQVFFYFHNHHMKIKLGDRNTKMGRQVIFKPTIWNESQH
jgi:hypothetical protein